MALSDYQCAQIASLLAERSVQFDEDFVKERLPSQSVYLNAYPSKVWKADTGDEKDFDIYHAVAPNDNGIWDKIDSTDCMQPLCNMPRKQIGWGSTVRRYGKYRTEYTTQPFCYTKLRNMNHVQLQLAEIIKSLKMIPDKVVNAFVETHAMRQYGSGDDGMIYIAGEGRIELPVADGAAAANHAFFEADGDIDLGGVGNVPTSQLKMEYLNSYADVLRANGYHNGEYSIDGKFTIMIDLQTALNLTTQNPVLANMWALDNFKKGTEYYQYGLSNGCGNFLFKYNHEQPRYNHIGGGIMRRVMPWANVAAGTIGLRRQYSSAYRNAKYAMYHIYNREARTLFTSNEESINPEMKFGIGKGLMGAWKWLTPDVIITEDPNTGVQCQIRNDTHKQGYWVGEYELGIKNENPLIEMWILALREPAQPGDDVAITNPSAGYWDNGAADGYQDLKAYNDYFCPVER
jgi:hypothetical protein